MCGIFATFSCQNESESYINASRAALRSMSHRGPDAEGVWEDQNVFLGHRRLAILDLDVRSNQPFHSACGRYVMLLNGELYNFRQLRSEFEACGAKFRTTSDTEVVLEGYIREGPSILSRLRGMFAIIIWDRQLRQAFVARDPYGIKPLYYSENAQGIMLASQVRALLSSGEISREPDVVAQAGYWLFGSVFEPRTWFRAVRALPGGHYAWVRDGRMVEAHCWWRLADHWTHPQLPKPEDPASNVRSAVRSSLEAHLEADVPVGLFLSGGIDSGVLCALMSEAHREQITGVTVCFNEFRGLDADEMPAATAITRQYGIHHHIRVVTRNEFLSDLPEILNSMDQPSVDGVNTWYASKAAAEVGLKVVLSGVGGDELFQGYSHFRSLPRLVRGVSLVRKVPGLSILLQWILNLRAMQSGNPRWRDVMSQATSLYGAWCLRRGVFCKSDLPSLMANTVEGTVCDPVELLEELVGPLPSDPYRAIGQIESTAYLQNQLLRDSDWASMAHSLELRTPLVDAWLLRDLARELPVFIEYPHKSLLADTPLLPLPEIVRRKRKSGFGIPLETWMNKHPEWRATGSRGWAQFVAARYDA